MVWPLVIVGLELVITGGDIQIAPWGAVLLVWGYLQYRLVGRFRSRLGRGGPGVDVPPESIVASGPYGLLRNPMYAGHLIFMIGLAITFQSLPAVVLLAFHGGWFHHRVLADEARLEQRFGEAYLSYKGRVTRWVPGLF